MNLKEQVKIRSQILSLEIKVDQLKKACEELKAALPILGERLDVLEKPKTWKNSPTKHSRQ
jgi:hypothetical protein